MRPFPGKDVYDVAAEVGVWQAMLYRDAGMALSPRESVAPAQRLRRLLGIAQELDLPTSPGLIRGHLDQMESPAMGSILSEHCGDMLRENNRRVADEIGQLKIFQLSVDEVRVCAQPIAVPATLGDDASCDGAEAVCCYAAARYTAAGFHAMRLAERVARSLIPKAGLPKRKFYPSIDSIVSSVEKKLRREEERRRKKPKGRRGIPIAKMKWLSEIVATFRSVANAWRNPIGHYKSCEGVEALELINVARSLVRKYAEAQ